MEEEVREYVQELDGIASPGGVGVWLAVSGAMLSGVPRAGRPATRRTPQ